MYTIFSNPELRCQVDACDDPNNAVFNSENNKFTIPYWGVEDLNTDQEELRTCRSFKRIDGDNEEANTCTPEEFTNDTSQTGERKKENEEKGFFFQ